MNGKIKNEIIAFMCDYQKMCETTECVKCPMRGSDCYSIADIDLDRAIAAVEDWRESRKPKPEVIDKALDIYTIQIEVERGVIGAEMPTMRFAEGVSACIDNYYQKLGRAATIHILSAQRFVLESHREG